MSKPGWVIDIENNHPTLFRDRNPLGFGVDEGWKGIITRLCGQLNALGLPDLKVVQIKEKFGGLRFYVVGGNETVSGLIRKAEFEAWVTCERCGAPGRKHDGRQFSLTLCDLCETKRKQASAQD